MSDIKWPTHVRAMGEVYKVLKYRCDSRFIDWGRGYVLTVELTMSPNADPAPPEDAVVVSWPPEVP